MAGPRGQGAGRTDGFTGNMVEDHALAGVGASHDGDDQWRVGVELGQQLVDQQLEPLVLVWAGQLQFLEFFVQRLEMVSQLFQ